MLDAIGVGDVSDLFAEIPAGARFERDLRVPGPYSEIENLAYFKTLAGKNANLEDYTCFLGGGIYDHYVPEVVSHIVSRSEFYTSYTPYQPEVSQGMLQAIFEYQSLICQLTGMEVSNASMYDGATALAEAAIMACDETGRDEIVVSRAVHPAYRQVLQTYTAGMGFNIIEAPITEGLTNAEALAKIVTSSTGAVILQQPNFFGSVESAKEIGEIAKAGGAMFVVSADPISLGLLKAPADHGADIVTAEGQALGIHSAFGGPLLGIFATKKKYIWRLPGRLVGATTDTQGRRGYVLTLQTREQHIRREHATSNICTNQSLMAVAAAVYLSAMGKNGLREVADLCFRKAQYAYSQLITIPGIESPWSAPFFKEFAIKTTYPIGELQQELLDNGILGGLPLGADYPEYPDCLLFAVTEKRTREEIDHLVEVIKTYVRRQTGTADI